MTPLTTEDLHAQLRANAKGLYPEEAAVELLIRSDVWLRRPGFRDACIGTWGPTEHHPDLEPGAGVDWQVVGQALDSLDEFGGEPPEWLAVCSGGERRLIQVAHDIARGPMSEVSGLDRTNQALVLAAVSHAGGSQEHHPHPFVQHPDGTVSLAEGRREYLGPLFPWPETPDVPAPASGSSQRV